jgi:hypothetical protein
MRPYVWQPNVHNYELVILLYFKFGNEDHLERCPRLNAALSRTRERNATA